MVSSVVRGRKGARNLLRRDEGDEKIIAKRSSLADPFPRTRRDEDIPAISGIGNRGRPTAGADTDKRVRNPRAEVDREAEERDRRKNTIETMRLLASIPVGIRARVLEDIYWPLQLGIRLNPISSGSSARIGRKVVDLNATSQA